uniref:Uncharacterized protein n=1 Tax=Sinocyclocheilus rhinocerous TaxID=307959 RepID=A0A673GZC9_9TELE
IIFSGSWPLQHQYHGGAFLYLIRLARGPYVSWDKKNNPEPWNNLGPTYQYKTFGPIGLPYLSRKRSKLLLDKDVK